MKWTFRARPYPTTPHGNASSPRERTSSSRIHRDGVRKNAAAAFPRLSAANSRQKKPGYKDRYRARIRSDGTISQGMVTPAHGSSFRIHHMSSRKKTKAGVPRSRTRTIAAGGAFRADGLEAHAVYAKPPQGDPSAGIEPPNTTHLGYVLIFGGQRLYFTGDPINTFANHPQLAEAVAKLAPGTGFMTTHPTEGEFPFFDGCRAMAERVGVQRVVPAHYECFVKRHYDPNAFVALRLVC